MDEIRADLAGEDAAAIVRRPGVAVIYRTAACAAEMAPDIFDSFEPLFVITLLPQRLPLFSPLLRTRQGEDLGRRLPIFINIESEGGNFEQWGPRDITHRQNHVSQVRRVLGDKFVAPVVKRQAKLGDARAGL